MKLVLIFAAWGLLALGLSATDLPMEAIQAPPVDAVQTKSVSVPEPGALLVAGLGSLAILLLTTRRK